MSGDNAITSRAEDRFGRAAFADQLAAALIGETADQGLVAALVGPWGQGKSSVLNMVKEQLEGVHSRAVLAFNPWMFSGRDRLVSAFFEQVAGQLRLRGRTERALADRLLTYGQAVAPLVFMPVAGVWLGRISAVATAISRARGAGKRGDPIAQQRLAIEAALGKLADPIFVVIDDIDRLTAGEIRDMLGLVRLTAHFPKIIYLLAFDRAKVERSLDQDGQGDGRSYLDKIVELSFDMPAISQHALGNLLLEGIQHAVTGIETGPFDEDRWPDLLTRVISPLLSTPRDVNRYLGALPASLRMIGDEVALVDVLALEAIRLRLPDVFAQLGPLSRALTDVGMVTSQTPGWKNEVEGFVQSAREHAAVAGDLCRLLFPATERYLGSNTTYPSDWLPIWRKTRRVASPDVLGIYLSKQLPPGALPAATVELAVATMARRDMFQSVMDSLSADDLDDLLARLAGYEKDMAVDAVMPGCAVLLGLYPRLRTQSKGFPDAGPEFAVDRVVLQLLRRVDEAEERTRVVESLCAAVTGFTGRVRLLHLTGRKPNPDMERLIPVAESDRLFRQVCHEIRHAATVQLAGERDPLGLLATALAEDPADRADIDLLLEDDGTAAAVLLSAVAQVRGQAFGSVAVRTEHVLRWEQLGTVVGDNKAIAALIERVAAARADDEAVLAAVALARRYLEGWRPSGFLSPTSDLVVRQAANSPSMIFSPSVISKGWPALLVRAVATYEIDPAWAVRADVSGSGFHDRLTSLLEGVSLSGQVAALAQARDLSTDPAGWTPDQGAHQSARIAAQILTLGPSDQPAAVLRYAVFLPDGSGPMKLIADISLSPGEATDAKWGQLGLKELRDVLAAAVESTAGPEIDRLLRGIYSGEVPPRAGIELYLWSAQDQPGGRPSNALKDTIDLDSLGAPARADRPPLQGMFAVDGTTPVGTVQDRWNLIVHALIRMALDWGYLDARAKLVPLASG